MINLIPVQSLSLSELSKFYDLRDAQKVLDALREIRPEKLFVAPSEPAVHIEKIKLEKRRISQLKKKLRERMAEITGETRPDVEEWTDADTTEPKPEPPSLLNLSQWPPEIQRQVLPLNMLELLINQMEIDLSILISQIRNRQKVKPHAGYPYQIIILADLARSIQKKQYIHKLYLVTVDEIPDLQQAHQNILQAEIKRLIADGKRIREELRVKRIEYREKNIPLGKGKLKKEIEDLQKRLKTLEANYEMRKKERDMTTTLHFWVLRLPD
jgi:hypothetical protein